MSDEFEDLFAEEQTKNTPDHSTADCWKVIIADDAQEVHDVTRIALKDVSFYGRNLQLINCYSGRETVEALREHPDTALILLDVVMEDEEAGLTAVKKIRQELANRYVRIILRTGQPGKAPEKDIILNYDINYYVTKAELTAQRLFTTVISALRSYHNFSEVSREVSRTIINCAQVGILVVEEESENIVEVNPTAQSLIGLTNDQILGKNRNVFFSTPEILTSDPDSGKITVTQERVLHSLEGKEIPVLQSAVPVTLQGHKYLIETFLDITDRKELEERLKNLAYYDTLTEIPNRMFFYELLSQELRQALRYENNFAVMYIDLNLFKQVNDQYGHHVGDVLLQRVAKRLKESIRESDNVARLGGDEFAVLLSNPSQRQEAKHVADRIIQSMNRPFEVLGNTCKIGACIGIALFPDDGKDIDSLLVQADTAMYQAKKKGMSNYVFNSE